MTGKEEKTVDDNVDASTEVAFLHHIRPPQACHATLHHPVLHVRCVLNSILCAAARTEMLVAAQNIQSSLLGILADGDVRRCKRALA